MQQNCLKTLNRTLLGVLLLSGLSLPASAVSGGTSATSTTSPAPPASGTQKIMSSITAKEAAVLLKEAGFADLEIDKDDDIVVKMQGYKVLVLVGTNKGSWLLFKFALSGASMQGDGRKLTCAYSDGKGNLNVQTQEALLTNIKGLNEWNKNVKYSRAYVDDDGDIILESDQDLTGGITPERLKEFAKSFDISLREFLKKLE